MRPISASGSILGQSNRSVKIVLRNNAWGSQAPGSRGHPAVASTIEILARTMAGLYKTHVRVRATRSWKSEIRKAGHGWRGSNDRCGPLRRDVEASDCPSATSTPGACDRSTTREDFRPSRGQSVRSRGSAVGCRPKKPQHDAMLVIGRYSAFVEPLGPVFRRYAKQLCYRLNYVVHGIRSESAAAPAAHGQATAAGWCGMFALPDKRRIASTRDTAVRKFVWPSCRTRRRPAPRCT